MRRILLITALLALSLMPTQSATADEQPVRSGTILPGLWGADPTGSGTCEGAPDCAAWLNGGCQPALTGRDPAVMTSIEDVADLADGVTLWQFEFKAGPCCDESAVIQLWRPDCTEISGSGWSSRSCAESCRLTSLLIPASAKWMTVTGYAQIPWPGMPAEATLDWTLTGRQSGRPATSPSPVPTASPTPTPASEPTTVERSVDLQLRGHLRALGEVISDENACAVDVPLVIQRKRSAGWDEVGSTATGADGAFAVRLNDRAGRYRAIAVEVKSPEGAICLETESPARQHRH